MAQQESFSDCKNPKCGKKLQVVVKYCPFCGENQSPEPAEDSLKNSDSTNVFEESTSTNLVQETASNFTAEENIHSALVTHLTQKTGKELKGVILENIDLDEAKTYDRFAFRKNTGVFIRLDHLHKVPDNLLNHDQQALKHEDMVEDELYDLDDENSTETNQLGNSESVKESKKTKQPTQDSAQIPPPLHSKNEDKSSSELAANKPKSNTKYVIIAFSVIFFVIYLVFSGDATPPSGQEVAKPKVMDCTIAIAEINTFIESHQPSRALSVIQMYKNDCKQESHFIELATNAETQANAAKAKLELAKEYMQKGNLDIAEASAKTALEMDSELVGANELLQQIGELKTQKQDQQNATAESDAAIENAATTEPEQSVPNVAQQNQAALEQRRQDQEVADKAKQQVLARQQAVVNTQRLQGQEAMEKVRQQVLERQQAVLSKIQDEQKYSGALGNADRALRNKSYGSAKRIAKEVLATSPNNPSAMRILHQAEEGESKAFDEMVIE